ncbi:MAG: ATP-binding cassette domain-containing protein [Candidatus Heimdallarchaeota archaeon]
MTWQVEFNDLTKTYGPIAALTKVNLQIRRGEIFTLLGPNGSGKTTALRIMAGIDTPTSGAYYFAGEKVTEAIRSKVCIQSTLIFQRTILFNTTVYKNIAYGLMLRGWPKTEISKEIKAVLKLVKLEGFEKRAAKHLSGGEQQRVSLARALVLKTDLLLLDEPTANLDPQSTAIIEETITRVNQDHETTIVLATHNLFQAETLTERGAIFIQGRIFEIGKLQELLRKASPAAQHFVRLDNLFTGPCQVLPDGTSRINIGKKLYVEAAFQHSGQTTIYIRPEDIVLAITPFTSSARNVFSGKIIVIEDQETNVRLRVDVGKPFTVQITRKSFEKLQLKLGTPVYLIFKASSVHLI